MPTKIAPGSRLGPYEIVAPIGAGGMGEVWNARDTRLDRSVAIKILSVEFAQNDQLRLRFEREEFARLFTMPTESDRTTSTVTPEQVATLDHLTITGAEKYVYYHAAERWITESFA